MHVLSLPRFNASSALRCSLISRYFHRSRFHHACPAIICSSPKVCPHGPRCYLTQPLPTALLERSFAVIPPRFSSQPRAVEAYASLALHRHTPDWATRDSLPSLTPHSRKGRVLSWPSWNSCLVVSVPMLFQRISTLYGHTCPALTRKIMTCHLSL
jgi:hypothetical protein